jgi:phage terminase large subunit
MAAKDDPRWYAGTHPVTETRLVPDDVLAQERESMPDELYRQEWLCDPSAANVGAILGSRIEEAEREGRISVEPLYNPTMPVIASSDIGFRDAAAWWFWQPRPDGFALVGYDEESGLDADDWIPRLTDTGYQFDKIWLPHDARAKTFATKRSAMERFHEAGLTVRLTPNVAISHRVNAARLLMPRCRFDKTSCAVGLKRLRNWAYKWDDVRRVFQADPLHDENSHGGDAFSYGALIMRETVVQPATPRALKQAAANFKLDDLWKDHDREQEEREFG